MLARRIAWLGVGLLLIGRAQGQGRLLEESEPQEVVSLRDGHTRAFQVRRRYEEAHPVTGEVAVREAVSRYFVKGGGICYRSGGEWLVSNPHWVRTPAGFAVAEAGYRLESGELLSSGVVLESSGERIRLRPARLEIVGSGGEKEVLLPQGDIRGQVDPGDGGRLVFPGAYAGGGGGRSRCATA